MQGVGVGAVLAPEREHVGKARGADQRDGGHRRCNVTLMRRAGPRAGALGLVLAAGASATGASPAAAAFAAASRAA